MSSTTARPAFRRRAALALVTLLVALLLVACASGARTAQQAGPAVAGDRLAGAPNQGTAAGPSSAPDAAEVDAQRRIVKTGEITVRVASVAEALGRVRAMTQQLGGYVGGSQAGTLEDSATLTLRIPAERFDDALAALHQLDGKVLVEATREEDVTSTIVDLGARVANLEASEAQYRALLARAEKIEDVLSVQSRLDEVRGQIEQLKGQLKSVSGQADLATLTVTLTPEDKPVQQASSNWDPGATASRALAALVGIGQGLASAVIWFGIVWLPILLILAIVAMLVLRALLELRRRLPATPGDTSVG
jgi:cytochrome c556